MSDKDADMQLKYDVELINLEKTYVTTHGILFDLIEKRDAMRSTAVPANKGTITVATPGLPHVPLPVFDGSYENWFNVHGYYVEISM